MTPAVQADSLSAITALAANPPKYPRNPTEEVRRPLVLYIARVPGSKDVFLTTMKPRQKVVTAEDVSSSLYYLHVDHPDDISLRARTSEEEEHEEHESKKRRNGEQKGVSRKPVPSLSSVTELLPELRRRPNEASGSSVPPDAPSGLEQDDSKNFTNATKRKPVGSEDRSQDPFGPAEVRRRPLGPRAESPRQHAVRRPLSSSEKRSTQAESVYDLEPLPPPLPPRTAIPIMTVPSRGEQASRAPLESAPVRGKADSATQAPHEGVLSGSGISSGPDATFWNRRSQSISSLPDTGTNKGFSVTLIRRDPASGGQWNVGKIYSHAAAGLPGDGDSRASTQRYTIQIEITNPGYNQFLRSRKAVILPTAMSEGADNSAATDSASDEVFQRQISGEFVSSWIRNPWKRRSGSSELSLDGSASNLNDGSQRRGSGTGTTGAGAFPPSVLSSSSSPQKMASTIDSGPGRVREKGYTFLSPWDGTCEFFTGATGRSLKCKHTIISPASSAAAQSVTVSELRINLPSLPFSNILTSPTSSTTTHHNQDPDPSAGHAFRKRLSSQISPILNRVQAHVQAHAHVPGDDDDEDHHQDHPHRLDLRLGQEKAGGGTRGKSAKLGKVIVEDEGLKMLDLIVAANMGIWWRAYDKVGGGGWRLDD